MDSGFFVWLALSFCFGYNEAKRETNVLFILKKFGESMISYIKGTLERRGENDIIVEAGGIVSPATLAKLPQTGEAVQIFTYFSVKEDGMSLYGFAAREEQEMFEKLLLVNGVGPKGALGFLSVLNPSEIVMAILSDDVKTLSKAPGVGRKTANVVLNTAFGHPTIAVDTHIFRVCNRTNFAPGKDVVKVEEKLLKVVPKEFKVDVHHWLILHGRYTCTARKPRCGACIIEDLCEYKEKTEY